MARQQGGSERRLSELLDVLNGIPFGENTWQTALTGISDFLGAECADLTVMSQDSSACLRVETVRMDTQAIDFYMRTFMGEGVDVLDVHPRVRVASAMKKNQVVADADFWRPRERDGMTFFREFYRPRIHCEECIMGGVSGIDDPHRVMLAAHFRSAVPQQRPTRNRMQMLLPHMRRVVAAEEALKVARGERDTLSAALDRVTDALVLLAKDGRVMRANPAAEAFFGHKSGVDTAADGRLVLATMDARAALALALAQCATPLIALSAAGAPPPVRIAVQRPDRHPLLLTLQPLPSGLSGAFGAVAILFIVDPDAKSQDRTSALRTAYGLTAAEARLMQGLCEGLVLKEIADRQNISYETVRSHLRRILVKTGARRQSDLVKLGQSVR